MINLKTLLIRYNDMLNDYDDEYLISLMSYIDNKYYFILISIKKFITQ